MVKKDLIEKSPIRRLEKTLGGGLKAGEVGVIAAQKGVGKTSLLVQLGIDELLQGNRVFHISFSQGTDYALTWYNNMFDELAKHKNLESADAIKNEVLANRVVLNFNQDMITTAQIMKTVKALTEGAKAKPHALMIDDFDFSKATKESITEFKSLAKELGVSIWFTAKVDAIDGIPCTVKPFIDDIDVILLLKQTAYSEVGITAVKDHSRTNIPVDVKFDTKSLLLA